jgi:hypothetical protein
MGMSWFNVLAYFSILRRQSHPVYMFPSDTREGSPFEYHRYISSAISPNVSGDWLSLLIVWFLARNIRMAENIIPQKGIRPTWLLVARFIVRWSARLIAGFLLSIAIMIIVGEGILGDGGPNFAKEGWNFTFMTAAGLTALTGFVVLWWSELWGGLLVLGGMAVFFGLNYLASGKFPGGSFLTMCYLPGILAVISWLLARLTSPTPNQAVNPPK